MSVNSDVEGRSMFGDVVGGVGVIGRGLLLVVAACGGVGCGLLELVVVGAFRRATRRL